MSWQTLSDIWIFSLQIGLNITILLEFIGMLSQFDGKASELMDPEINEKQQFLRGLGYRYNQINFLEAISICLCVMNFLTLLLSHYKPMAYIISEFFAAVPGLMAGTGFWLLS